MSKVNLEANANLHLHVDGQEEINQLNKTVAGLTSQLTEAGSKLQEANARIAQLKRSLRELEGSDIGIVNSELQRFKDIAEQGAYEIRRMLEALNIDQAIGNSEFVTQTLTDVKNGAITVGQAISNIKSNFKYLFEENYSSSGGLFDTQMVQSFTASLDIVINKLNVVSEQVSSLMQNGIPSAGSAANGAVSGTVDVSPILNQIRTSVEGMTEEARAAYEPITQLLLKLTEYANLDATKLLGVSQAFRNIADIGSGAFSDKKIANITSLLRLLENANGSKLATIHFDAKGFNELHVRKASLSNLAEFLPKIQKVNAAKLQELANVNLTNFNNVKVSKASLNAIADLSNYQDSLKLLKDTIDQVVTSINSLNSSMNGGGGGNGGGGNNGGNSPSEVDLLKRMADASTQSHRLLEGNIQSKDTAVYQQFSSTLTEIDTILEACHRDASQLPAALNGTSMEDAIAKIKSLLTQLSALRNELTFTGDTGTFSRRNINDTLNSMLTLRNRSGDYSGTTEYKDLEVQIRLFGDAIQWCRTQGVSLNEAFKHFGTDGKSAIEAANTAMSSLRLKVTETAQGIADTKILDEAAIKSDWKIRGLEERDINRLYRQVRLMADGSNEFKAIEKQYNALVTEQNIWAASGKSYTAAEVQNITQMRASLKALMEQYISDAKKIKTLEDESLAKSRATQRADWKVGGIETGNISSLYSQVQKLQGDQSALNEIKTKYEQLIRLQTLWEENGRDLTAPEVQSITKLREELKALMEQYINTSRARSKTAAADLDAKWQSQGLTASNIKSLFGKASNNKELFSNFEAVRKQYENVLRLHASLDKKNLDPARVKLVEDETRALRDLIQARLSDADAKRKQSAESRKQSSDEAKQQSLLRQGYTLLTRLKKEEANWTAARKGRSSGSYSDLQRYRQELETLLHTVESTKMPFDEFKAKFSEISRRASESESVIRSNGEATQTWRERIGGLASKFGSWFSITRVIMAAVRAVRQLITSAKEIDTALTQLKIVTNASNEEMKKFANTAIDLAHNLGKSVAELTKSIETFSRLGYSLTDAAELAKYATIMSNVAGVSTEEATTGITSIIKGYDKDVEDAEHVADILVEVGQKYAVSAAEMMEAYEKSGAALHATNTSLEKSAGLIAAANASVQDASVVGKKMPSLTVM